MTEKTRRYTTYILLLSAVEVTMYLIGDRLPTLEGLTLYLFLGLAAFRGGRAVSFNGVFVWLRDLLQVKATPDSSGAGDSNNPYGTGPVYVLGELLCCPICSGTWVAAGLLVLLALVPHLGNAMVLLLGVAGIAEVLHWTSEAMEWTGRDARERSGTQWLAKNDLELVPSYNGRDKVQVDPYMTPEKIEALKKAVEDKAGAGVYFWDD